MPIGNIAQTISTIPEAGRRGVDVQTQFVIKQEDFQDHLQGTTITELNTLKDQLNTRIGEINSTTTTMDGYATSASSSASTATTKAGEASTSASEALTSRNQASTFATNSSNSATKASQWADNNYNIEVETGKYSAKHWSTVAQNTVANKIDKVTSTDNAIVRFDGTSGKVQNSGVIIDDNDNLNITGTGKRITGDFSNTTYNNRVAFQTSTVNGSTIVSAIPNGTGTATTIDLYNNSSINVKGQIGCNPSEVFIRSSVNSGIGYIPITFQTGGSDRMRIDTAGNVLVTGGGGLGYGTGSGGTVIQLTNKSTAVTLNKPTGQIIMNNAALAAGAVVTFNVNNSLLSLGDLIYISISNANGVNVQNYNCWVSVAAVGLAFITIKNIYTSSLSDAVEVNFVIIKGAIA